MAYDEGQVRAFAQALFAAGDSVRDGLDAGDAASAVGVITALTGVLDEMKDTDAFACHLASELTDLLGDELVDKAAEVNWRKLAGAVGGIAATAAAGAVNPALGAVVGSALGSGAAAKEAGKRYEKRGGTAVHKLGAPVAAVAGAGVAAQFVDPVALCDAVQQVCASPVFVSGGVGAAMIGMHSIWDGLTQAGARRG